MPALINLTLIIQALNFFIAYLILRYFLLKPGLQALDQEDTQQANLVMRLEHVRLRMLEKQQQLLANWQEYKKSFARNTPLVSDRALLAKQSLIPISRTIFDQSMVQEKVHELQDTLSKKVTHVRL